MSGAVPHPLVARVQRLSADDGPGLRDVVFFKGCRLACAWCHNPETMAAGYSMLFFREQCVGCHRCAGACPEAAIQPRGDYRIERSQCRNCGRCAEVCPARALQRVGIACAPEALVEHLVRDRLYFDNSGGGVTFSGGEPTLHLEYLERVGALLKERGISLALETNGDFSWEDFEQRLLCRLDLVYFDLKLMDSVRHRQYTGIGNRRILANLTRLARQKPAALIARTPLIPGITDTAENLGQIAAFLTRLGVASWVKLPYNPTGTAKWESLGQRPGASGKPANRARPAKFETRPSVLWPEGRSSTAVWLGEPGER